MQWLITASGPKKLVRKAYATDIRLVSEVGRCLFLNVGNVKGGLSQEWEQVGEQAHNYKSLISVTAI